MKTKLLLLIVSLFLAFPAMAQDVEESTLVPDAALQEEDHLVVLWTSRDADVAKKMVFMYVYNAKKYAWWKEITFIIWGPSSKLLAEDEGLQEELQKMKEEGIVLEACKACADQYGVSENLKALGVDVKYMGVPLTKYIKSNSHVVTF